MSPLPQKNNPRTKSGVNQIN